MLGPTFAAVRGDDLTARGHLVRKLMRYAAGSMVATVCSYATFVFCYGLVHTGTAVASTIGWLAGAIPNYWLNRSWTWRRSGRPHLGRELLPYIAIVLVTVLLAVVATSVADSMLQRADVSDAWRTVLVSGTFLAVYGVVFLLRFFLLDKLFTHPAPPPASVEPVAAKEPV